MSLARRIAALFRAKAHRVLDSAEDPREVLDYSYSRQLELLNQVRRGVADVATSRKRVELQLSQLRESAARLEEQARQALSLGKEEIARQALTRRATALSRADELQGQYASLQEEENRLTAASRRLQAKVEAFRTHKEVIKATYTTAEAHTRISESVTGLSEEMGDVGLAVQRAEDRTAQLQARAGALDELLASGVLEDATLPAGRDDLQAQLEGAVAGGDIDEQLDRMKRELHAAPASAALPTAPTPSAPAAESTPSAPSAESTSPVLSTESTAGERRDQEGTS
ncbi:PspA/IM30 family protein [Streptosporangium fragile]|uniref:PspA/IM30 family protein n=1 Tax=Streptosporangium fragile TaxID=46186 RepID=A0ABN3WFA9_9ACTN